MPVWFHAPDYWVARLVLQRGLAAVYLIAFLVALNQFRPLLGERGLLPVPRYLSRVRFRDAPSLFHLGYSDRRLTGVSLLGIALSAVILVGLPDHWPIAGSVGTWLLLWALYLSIVNVGQTFYGFGWESLLCEAGFLAAFLGPAWSAVPTTIIWLFRWLLFRVEFGAGLIKLRGDPCWRDLTCLDFHHETQPMPGPLSWYFHRLPRPFHRVEVLGSHLAQLVAPVLLFAPQPIATFAALFMALTQLWLVLSGNYAWLNWNTILLTVSGMDDRVIGWVFPVHTPGMTVTGAYDWVVVAVTVGILALSVRPALNLLSGAQLMNASFEPLRLVNTYGAFGSVTKERHEVVVEGTMDAEPSNDSVWREYEFKGKPTDPKRRPPQWAPYHLRLDWLMWFAGLSPAYAYSWFLPLVIKLLQNDAPTLKLLRRNPFPEAPPRAIRAVLYRYRYSTWRERRETGAWWVRVPVREYLRPIGLEDVVGSERSPTGPG